MQKKLKEYSNIIKEKINLETSPTAIKIYEKEEDAEKNFKKIDTNIMHCQAIITAGKDNSFYATKNELGCPFGIATLGLMPIPDELKNGTSFDNMNVAKDKNAGETLYNQVPKMNKQIEAISYMPLDKAIDNPDLIVIIAKPIQIFNLVRAYAYTNGERVDCNVGGTQSLCGDITSNTYNSSQAKISFGCMGSHMATELEEDQVIMSIPFDRLDEFTEALSIVTQPPKRP